MKAKIAKLISVAAMLLMLAGTRPAVCQGWSPWNPLASGGKSESNSKKPVSRTAKKPPSTWDKIASGTKNFFGKIDDAFSFKKSPPKKRTTMPYAHPRYPGLTAQNKKESKSWFDSWFGPKEPEKPRNVSEWMEQNKRLDP
ncbi:MAG: hypothetical protein KKE86_05590 [Planctomycetes bacterium]|nr:hypothetical protein [Planctomycetota bacterium]MBU4398794.1 hypothetical protein [Planctomycetota bacterium]MCG2685456.1 hypothetical protein [Planctomycetales bacterium]